MKFKVIVDIQGNFEVEDRNNDFEITCPFCENIDIYHIKEDTDLYCSKCGKMLVIKGKGRTCFDFDDVTKLKNIIKRGTTREDRRNALILLGRVLEWCEDLTLAEFLLHLSLMDPDKWVRDKAEQILSQQREAGTEKVKSEIKKLKSAQTPPVEMPPVPYLEEKKEDIPVQEEVVIQEEITEDFLSEQVEEQKEDTKKAKLVDILLEVMEDEKETIERGKESLQDTSFQEPGAEVISSSVKDSSYENIDELLEVAMSSIENTKEVLENVSDISEVTDMKEFTHEDTCPVVNDMEECNSSEVSIPVTVEEYIDDTVVDELLDRPIEDLLDGITVESLLEEFLITEDFNEKADILFIIGEMKFIEATDFLLDLLVNDRDYDIRLVALQSLEKIGDKQIANSLLDAIKKEVNSEFRKKIANIYSKLKYY